MKKVILLVSVVLALTACSEKPQEIETTGPIITGEWVSQPDTLFTIDEETGEAVIEEKNVLIRRDTLYGVDETGDIFMIIEETVIPQ